MRRLRRLLLAAFVALGLAPAAIGYFYVDDWSPEPPGKREQAADRGSDHHAIPPGLSIDHATGPFRPTGATQTATPSTGEFIRGSKPRGAV